jgi:ABC-type uncharacterized transport system substrate-binding protein
MVVVNGVIIILGAIFGLYFYFRKPDEENEAGITEINLRCRYLHKSIDENILSINQKLDKFENNHMRHIEPDIRKLQTDMVRALTILESLHDKNNRII